MTNKARETCTVTIVGGGNSAHVLIPFLGETHHTVNLFTRRPDDWEDTITCEVRNGETGVLLKTFRGTINKISSDPADVIPEADIVILCLPVHTYRPSLAKIGPYISREKKEVFVGTVYGQAGFNWMVHEMEQENKLTNTVAFAVGLIPWICRTAKYGSLAYNYGGKQMNIAAVTPPDRFDRLNEILFEDICYTQLGTGNFVQACSFVSITLSVDNQIIHPSRIYGLWKKYNGGKWETHDDVPFFYKDFDDFSADCIKNVDDDFEAIRNAIRRHFPERPFKYMLSYLELERLSHNSQNVDIKLSIKDSKQLAAIKTPVVQLEDGTYMINTQCRFFTDDFPYGLVIAKWIAEKLGVEVPFITHLIRWDQNIRGDKYLAEEGKIDLNACLAEKYTTGIPPSYGIASIENILD